MQRRHALTTMLSFRIADIFYLTLVFFMVISAVFSLNPGEYSAGYVFYCENPMHFLAYYWLYFAGTLIDNAKYRKNLLFVFIAVALFESIFAFLQTFDIELSYSLYYHTSRTAYGLTQNSNFYGGMCILFIACISGVYIFADNIIDSKLKDYVLPAAAGFIFFFSQMIALFLTDTLFFLILAALLRAWPELFRFIVCVLLQIIVSLVWCIAVSEWYTRTFDKRKAVIIYDSIHNLHEISGHKQFKKSFDLMGTYDIDEVKFSTASDRKAWLIDKIKDADAVFVMELHSHDRNIIVKYCVEHEISCYNEPKIGDILMSS